MSAAEQLDLGAIGSAKRKKDPLSWTTCRCGHEQNAHVNRKHSGACTRCGGDCKRFKAKGRKPVEQPPHLQPPAGSILLERTTEKRGQTKIMGWAIVRPRGPDGVEAFNGVAEATGLHAIIYLTQLKTKSLNENPTGMPPWMIRRLFAALGAYKKTCRDRTVSAIAQVDEHHDVVARGKPSRVVITRVSTGSLDDDNLIGAMKHIRDGVAEALEFNDRLLSIQADPSRIPLSYREELPGKTGVFGVRIEITWKGDQS